MSKEIERFKSMNNAAEKAVLRAYIETILGLPWDKKSKIPMILKRHGRYWKKVITV